MKCYLNVAKISCEITFMTSEEVYFMYIFLATMFMSIWEHTTEKNGFKSEIHIGSKASTWARKKQPFFQLFLGVLHLFCRSSLFMPFFGLWLWNGNNYDNSHERLCWKKSTTTLWQYICISRPTVLSSYHLITITIILDCIHVKSQQWSFYNLFKIKIGESEM